MRAMIFKTLHILGFSLFGSLSCFGMACNFTFSPGSPFISQLASLPESGADWQHIEIELKDGRLVTAHVRGSIYLGHDGTATFSEADIKRITKIFSRAGSQIWP